MKNNEPYQKYIDNGCFRTTEQKYSMPDGSIRIMLYSVRKLLLTFREFLTIIRNNILLYLERSCLMGNKAAEPVYIRLANQTKTFATN